MQTVWAIRGIVQNNHPVPNQEHERIILSETLEAIPEDLQQPMMDHIVNRKPIPPELQKRCKKAEKTFIRLMALKLGIMFEWEHITF